MYSPDRNSKWLWKHSAVGSSIHGTLYSYIAVQAAYLATYFPEVYWDCAYLRVTSGLDEDASTNYAKVAKAVGNMKAHGIDVVPLDINKSNYLFEPDEEHNAILFGMKGVNGTGGEVLNEIIANRPYSSFADFQERTNINKTTTIALIKGGAFDGFSARECVMRQYLSQECNPKKRLTLQNFKGLIDNNLIPSELDFCKRLFTFNKALKQYMKRGDWYFVTNNFYDFYAAFFDVDELEVVDGATAISPKKWQKMYAKAMEPAKAYLKDHQEEMLEAFNGRLLQEQWDKYAKGSLSAWEMDALGYYHHEHELAHVNMDAYNIVSYRDLPEVPPVEYTFKCNGKEIPIFKTYRIAGTVIGKNNTKAQVDILTTDSGVVTVKFNLDYFAKYNRRISANINGESKVVEQGWFSKGTLVVVNGYRRGDTFRAKRYKKTPSHELYKITSVNGAYMTMTNARYGEEEED